MGESSTVRPERSEAESKGEGGALRLCGRTATLGANGQTRIEPGDLRHRILAARDARQAAMDRWLGRGETLVALSLAVPGAEKAPPGAAALFARAVAGLAGALPGARRVHAAADALGPFELWRTAEDARDVKRRCVALEEASPAARLLDLDVYAPEGEPIDRASLHLPARRCLVCGEPARDCVRARRHPPAEAVTGALRLLAGAGAGAAGERAR